MLEVARNNGISWGYAYIPERALRAYAALGLCVWERESSEPSPEMVKQRSAMAGYFKSQDPCVVVFTEASA